MTAVGGTDARDRPFANWTIGQLLLLVLTLLISLFVINCLLLAFTGLLAWWSLVRHANCNLCQPEGFKSSTSTDCKFIDFSWWEWCLWTALLLGLKGPLSSVSHCWSSFTTWTLRSFSLLWTTVLDLNWLQFIDFSGWDWCLWSALLLGPKGPLSSAAHCWSSFTTLFFQGVPLVINCLLLASTGPLPAASLGRHASLHYSSCITQVASLKLHYSSCITQVALLKLQYQVALLKLHYSSCITQVALLKMQY